MIRIGSMAGASLGLLRESEAQALHLCRGGVQCGWCLEHRATASKSTCLRIIIKPLGSRRSATLTGLAAIVGGYGWRAARIDRKQRDLQHANEVLESKVRERTSELAEQRNLLRTLIDHLPDSIFIKDTQSRVVIDNVAHAQLLGLSNPAEAVGKTDLDCLPREQAGKFYTAEQELVSRGTEYEAEETILDVRTGESRWLRTTKVPLRDSSGKIIGLAGINRDITERKKWEAEAESLHRKLVEASRHAGMAEVATSVLHNVGNVLNSVNISSSLVSDTAAQSASS